MKLIVNFLSKCRLLVRQLFLQVREDSLTYLERIESPDDFDNQTFGAAVGLVESGGAINGSFDQISCRLKSAAYLAVLIEAETKQIIAVAALKSPISSYRKKCFENAGREIEGFEDAKELGYVSVAEGHSGQGLGRKVTELIVARFDGPAFATTGNQAMEKILGSNGFCKVGSAWKGKEGCLSLLIRNK